MASTSATRFSGTRKSFWSFPRGIVWRSEESGRSPPPASTATLDVSASAGSPTPVSSSSDWPPIVSLAAGSAATTVSGAAAVSAAAASGAAAVSASAAPSGARMSRPASAASTAWIWSIASWPSTTSWNSRYAACWTSVLARSSSWIPGSSTMIRSSPTFWISGSETPNWSTRLRMISSARSIASRCSSPVKELSVSSSSSSRCMPP